MRISLLSGVALSALFAIGFAQAADLAPAPVYPAPVYKAVPVFSWTGFYVGGQGGFAWGQSEQYDPFGATTGRYDISGGFGGGTVGYNWQVNSWVFGLEGDISGSGIKGGASSSPSWGCVVPGGCVTEVKWFGTARGRVGYAAGPWLFYGTGGAAFGSVHTFIATTAFDGTVDRTGWTAGAGIEYGFAPHWSVKVEYLHVDLGSNFQWTTFAADPGLTRAEFNLIRGGINYRF
jgi:outer membrane immunogenic protein